jgi:hypothetical protein
MLDNVIQLNKAKTYSTIRFRIRLEGKRWREVTEIDDLEKAINEDASEQRRLAELFKVSMNEFASERSIEACLGALNLCIQLAGIRKKLMEYYEQYARLLENEITRLRIKCEENK